MTMPKLVIVRITLSGGSDRVVRGGSWSSGGARILRSSLRRMDWLEYRLGFLGLRLVRRLP